MSHKIQKVPWVVSLACLTIMTFMAAGAEGITAYKDAWRANTYRAIKVQPAMMQVRPLTDVTAIDVQNMFATRTNELHVKVDKTRDAYLGFIFPVDLNDLLGVADALDLDQATAKGLYKDALAFSTFRRVGGEVGNTNHIIGGSLLALRNKSLDTGLASVNNESLATIIDENKDAVMKIAKVRESWFGKIYFPAVAFENAIDVYGGNVSADALYELAADYGFAAMAGQRKTIRGDFGIAVWLTLLGKAP